MTILSLSDISYSVDGHSIIDRISLEVSSGDWLAIAGRNGSGKSTLLRLMANLIKPTIGDIRLNGTPYLEIARIHQQLSIMSQRSEVHAGLRVLDLVRLGRYPYLSSWQFQLSSQDKEHVDYAIDFAGLNDLRNRSVSSLSGGERQRAFLALALAQDGTVLLFDEPTNHLDIVAQYHVLRLLKKLTDQGKLVVSVLHDLNHIAKYCTKLALLNDGSLHGFGTVNSQFNSTSLSTAYGIDIQVDFYNDRYYVEY